MNAKNLALFPVFLSIDLCQGLRSKWSERSSEHDSFQNCRASNAGLLPTRVRHYPQTTARPRDLSPLLSSLIHSRFQTPASETLFRTSVRTYVDGRAGSGRIRPCIRTYIDVARSVMYPSAHKRGHEGCAVESTRGMRRFGQGGWRENGIATDRCKNKEPLFFCRIKVSMLPGLVRSPGFPLTRRSCARACVCVTRTKRHEKYTSRTEKGLPNSRCV